MADRKGLVKDVPFEVFHRLLTEPDGLSDLYSLRNVSDNIDALFVRFIKDCFVNFRLHDVVHFNKVEAGQFVLLDRSPGRFRRGHDASVGSHRRSIQDFAGDVEVGRQQLSPVYRLTHPKSPWKPVHVSHRGHTLQQVQQMLAAGTELVYVHVGEARNQIGAGSIDGSYSPAVLTRCRWAHGSDATVPDHNALIGHRATLGG